MTTNGRKRMESYSRENFEPSIWALDQVWQLLSYNMPSVFSGDNINSFRQNVFRYELDWI